MTERLKKTKTQLSPALGEAGQADLSIRRMQMASDLFEFAFQVKNYQLKIRFPDLNERELYLKTMKCLDESCARW